MEKEKIIIIGGGVGPAAGTLLHNYIIENTLTNGTDQDHLDVYHFSRSRDIPDRTKALKNGTGLLPAEGMYRTFKIAADALESSLRTAVGGVPCNTFHAPEIFNKFRELTDEFSERIKLIDMVEETKTTILERYRDIKRIGLMSTTGTREANIYSTWPGESGLEVLEVPLTMQTELHETIYNKIWGIKAKNPVTHKAKSKFESFADYLVNQGAEIIILGCTEIPMALPGKKYRGIPLIDPMEALARALIREANPSKLKK